ncbi:hypothetical protein HNY73_015553 [Argiope bruennichi]|uniref:Uncharacterized protein n=1 Tax=Argiope bruennichi TaxID=94029 RepID=A0A8T0ETW4_ARGBR|nr:hypothetical protein HNY73_015553 [Argiope bruennichi]
MKRERISKMLFVLKGREKDTSKDSYAVPKPEIENQGPLDLRLTLSQLSYRQTPRREIGKQLPERNWKDISKMLFVHKDERNGYI